ncbi:ankyrin-3-like [Trichogramma pretiosum]|uniref:ankyrin-3-like n=1 Tax=Trichogramma pretiosum TaxID=7493 RepID=UPI000C718D34|nr:ankyrin-3-like [Trichogramma pretiosum]
MANNNDEYLTFQQETYDRLKNIKDLDTRLVEFYHLLNDYSLRCPESELLDRIFIDFMNCTSLFPSSDNKKRILGFAVFNPNLRVIKLLEASGLDIYEVELEDGSSALYCLIEEAYLRTFAEFDPKMKTLRVIEYFLKNPRENFCDGNGHTYLHAACMSGNVTAINLLLSRGVDVNLDSYEYSALHIAAQYRHLDVVQILLEHKANPNQPDHEQSMPLHALARLCLCHCTNGVRFCDKRKPVDDIIQTLIEYGANIEAQNRHGDRPLDLAVSRFDVQLVKSLLKYGASLDNLNEDKMFGTEFTSIELKNYPLTLNIIEMVQLLQSAGFKMRFETRLKMLKYWIKVRGNDTDHLIPEFSHPPTDLIIGANIFLTLCCIINNGFYIKQEAKDFLQQKSDEIKQKFPGQSNLFRQDQEDLSSENVSKLKNIMLTDDVSLYQLCQMNYSKGYSIVKKLNNWQLPPMDDFSCTEINLIVKRHVANILIRPHLELFAADLFMTDYCKLSLPYVACRRIAECMSHEELLRLCHQTDEDKLQSSPIRHKRRCDDDDTKSQPRSSRQRVP